VISDTDIDAWSALTDADLIFGNLPEPKTPYVYPYTKKKNNCKY